MHICARWKFCFILCFMSSDAPINFKPQGGEGVRHMWGIKFFMQIFDEILHCREMNVDEM